MNGCGTVRVSIRGVVAAVAVMTLNVTAACGAATGDSANRRPDSFSTLVPGTSVSPVPTSSPKVICIRAITDALRAVVDEQVTQRRVATELSVRYGEDSPQVRVFRDQLGAFRNDTQKYGVDVAGTMAWPALEAACN
jgi:hypothetical protein